MGVVASERSGSLKGVGAFTTDVVWAGVEDVLVYEGVVGKEGEAVVGVLLPDVLRNEGVVVLGGALLREEGDDLTGVTAEETGEGDVFAGVTTEETAEDD